MATAIESFWILQQRPQILLFLFHVQMQLVDLIGKMPKVQDSALKRPGSQYAFYQRFGMLSKIFKICDVELPYSAIENTITT